MSEDPSNKAAPLAYLNPEFLNSSDGRIVRIVSEYEEPLARLRRHRVQDTVVFFGSARFHALDVARAELEVAANTSAVARAPQSEQPAKTPQQAAESDLRRKRAEAAINMARYYEDARNLAYLLTTWSRSLSGRRSRFVVTSGGGPGIMEAANRGAHEAGGKTIGFNIRLPFEQFANPYITPGLNFEFHYFFMRKFWFAYLAKALVIFPGGFGTLDEMFELITLAQTEKLAKPMVIVVYGSEYWKQLINFQQLIDNGAISPDDMDLFCFADTPEDAFAYLRDGLTHNYLSRYKKDEASGESEQPALHHDGPEISSTNN